MIIIIINNDYNKVTVINDTSFKPKRWSRIKLHIEWKKPVCDKIICIEVGTVRELSLTIMK